jgi:hypothetical protein
MHIDDSLFDISKELFHPPLSDICFLEENPIFNEESSEILYTINPIEEIKEEEKEEIIIKQEYNNNELRNEYIKINIEKNLRQNNIKNVLNPNDSILKDFDKKSVKQFLRSIKNMENKIIRDLGYKKKISLGKYNNFLKNNTFDEIKHKTLKDIFAAISPTNTYFINLFSDIEIKRGKTSLMELNKLTFEEMYDYYIQDCKCIISGNHLYNLTGKFKTLKDVSKQNKKKLKKNKIKRNNKRLDMKEGEKPKEIEPEVCAIIID